MKIEEILPFLIPIVILEVILFGITLHHILTHEHYKRGNRSMWIIISIVGIAFLGPLLYFMIGREDA